MGLTFLESAISNLKSKYKFNIFHNTLIPDFELIILVKSRYMFQLYLHLYFEWLQSPFWTFPSPLAGCGLLQCLVSTRIPFSILWSTQFEFLFSCIFLPIAGRRSLFLHTLYNHHALRWYNFWSELQYIIFYQLYRSKRKSASLSNIVTAYMYNLPFAIQINTRLIYQVGCSMYIVEIFQSKTKKKWSYNYVMYKKYSLISNILYLLCVLYQVYRRNPLLSSLNYNLRCLRDDKFSRRMVSVVEFSINDGIFIVWVRKID